MSPDDDINLFEETVTALAENNKIAWDVEWVGSRDGAFSLSWDAFATLAKAIDYDHGYGNEMIPTALVVVGKDWWMERHNYDGSEWWEFKTTPQKQPGTQPFVLAPSFNKFHSLTEPFEYVIQGA